MIKRQIIFLLCGLLLTLLSGCLRPARVGAVGARVSNVTSEIAPEACAGGLRAIVHIANVELFNQTVALGQEEQRGTSELQAGSDLVYQGAPITAEA